jgi:glycosyltransferase involved in cell wall biosynthesis
MRVSTVIPVYNRESLVRRCLESALRMQHTDHEIIVVDNCSTDSTWSVIQEYASRESRVRCFRNERNLGPVRNWIRGVMEARGELCHILFSDDFVEPEFLSLAIPELRSDVGYVLVGHAKLDEFGCRSVSTFQMRSEIASEAILEAGVFFNPERIQLVTPVNALFRTRDLRTAILSEIPNTDGIDFASHGAGPDQLMFLLVAQRYPRVRCVDRVLVTLFSHSGSITVGAKDLRLPREWSRWHFVREYWPQVKNQYRTALYFRSWRLGSLRGLYQQVRRDVGGPMDFSYAVRIAAGAMRRGRLRPNGVGRSGQIG